MLQYCTNSFASVVMRRTGEQFFLLDGKEESRALLVSSFASATFGCNLCLESRLCL